MDIYVDDESWSDYVELVDDNPKWKSDYDMLSKACKIASKKLGKKLAVGYTDDGSGELELHKKQNDKIVPNDESMYQHYIYVSKIIGKKLNRPLFISEGNKIKKEYKSWYEKYNTKKDKEFINLKYKDMLKNEPAESKYPHVLGLIEDALKKEAGLYLIGPEEDLLKRNYKKWYKLNGSKKDEEFVNKELKKILEKRKTIKEDYFPY